MRSSVALTLAVAGAAVSAQSCNPTYNVATSGECFTKCNTQSGQKYVPGWTMDHTSSAFLDSLKLMCTKGTSEYLAFMSEAGMCMAGCPDDPALFVNEFADACSWYAEHKNDTCSSTVANNNQQNSTNGASKLQLSGYALALVAGAGYLAF